jgi:hypothetical protein
MSITDTQAAAEIESIVTTAWAGVAAIAGAAGNELRIEGDEKGTNPSGYWARLSIQIVSQELASFSDENTYGANQRRYETVGLVFIQLFAPKSKASSYDNGRLIAALVRDALRTAGVSGNVWFENVRVNPLTPDGTNYRWNIVGDIRYDTLQ